eukprot:3428515-Rhodomonas_salina.2
MSGTEYSEAVCVTPLSLELAPLVLVHAAAALTTAEPFYLSISGPGLSYTYFHSSRLPDRGDVPFLV